MFTEACEGEVEIVALLPSWPVVGPSLVDLAGGRGVRGEVGSGGHDLCTYTLSSPLMATIAVENKVGVAVSGLQLCARIKKPFCIIIHVIERQSGLNLMVTDAHMYM